MKAVQLTDEFATNDNMPILELDAESGEAILKGKCLPENANEMQAQLEEYLDPFLERGKLYFTLKLQFFNTASSKVFEIYFSKMQEYFKKGGEMKVLWCFQDDDEDMGEAGDEYAELVDFPFELKAY